MARCKLTSMNLRTIRKSREYQALLIDLVAMGVVGQSAAEETLGYTIPAGLLSGSTVTDDDDEEQGSGSGSGSGSGTEEQGSGSGTEGSGSEGSSDDTGITVTLIYVDKTANDGAGEYLTEELVLATNVLADEAAGIITAAKTAFTDDTINTILIVEQNPEYVEGTSELQAKYDPINPQPTELTEGALIACYHSAAVGQ